MPPAPAAHARFWQWFQANGDRLRAAAYSSEHAVREEAIEELGKAIAKVQQGLVLEFGPCKDEGPKPLIVSADRRTEHVDDVKAFVATAPDLPGWEVIAFRSRMEIGDHICIRLEDEEVSPEDIWFRVEEVKDGLDLTLHVRDLTPRNRRLRGLGASLMAEHAVGERDTLTLLNSMEVERLPDDPFAAGLQPFRELIGVFDRAKERKYPPPGSLSIDPEEDWQALQGTIDGSFALVLLNTSLRAIAGHPDYDRSLVVTIPFNETRDDGMPATEQEYDAVQDLGGTLSEEVGKGQEALLAATVMTQGRREMIFYVTDPEAALRRVARVQGTVETHRIETRVDWDTFWSFYRSFTRAAAEQSPRDA